MKIKCLTETRIVHNNREYLFEEFDYLYEVDDELGAKALATGNFVEIEPPAEGQAPSREWLAATEQPLTHTLGLETVER
jgi:hypothetical protein